MYRRIENKIESTPGTCDIHSWLFFLIPKINSGSSFALWFHEKKRKFPEKSAIDFYDNREKKGRKKNKIKSEGKKIKSKGKKTSRSGEKKKESKFIRIYWGENLVETEAVNSWTSGGDHWIDEKGCCILSPRPALHQNFIS